MLQSVSKKKLENLHLRTIPILEKHGTVFLNQRILSFHYKGDLVICEGGEPGRCAVWETDDRIFFQKALHRVRFTDDSTPKFYMLTLEKILFIKSFPFSLRLDHICSYNLSVVSDVILRLDCIKLSADIFRQFGGILLFTIQYTAF